MSPLNKWLKGYPIGESTLSEQLIPMPPKPWSPNVDFDLTESQWALYPLPGVGRNGLLFGHGWFHQRGGDRAQPSACSLAAWLHVAHICPLDLGAGQGGHQMSLCSSPWLFGLQEGLGTSLSHLPSGKVPPRNHHLPSCEGRAALCDVD